MPGAANLAGRYELQGGSAQLRSRLATQRPPTRRMISAACRYGFERILEHDQSDLGKSAVDHQIDAADVARLVRRQEVGGGKLLRTADAAERRHGGERLLRRVRIGVAGELAADDRGLGGAKLVDMEDINEKFAETDVALVVGANDVVNPAARTNPKSPIYGMPILKVVEAKNVIAMKRSRGAGFSGVENDLFVDPKTSMLFGDAKQSLITLGLAVKNA